MGTQHDLATWNEEQDPAWALLDEVLAAVGESAQRQLLAQVCARHPEHAATLRERFGSLESLGLLDGDEDGSTGLAIPERIGDFVLRERLGVGGMGVVFRAHQESLGRDVALKLVRPDFAFFDTQRRRFAREAEAIARLDHPSIVPIFAVGESEGLPYLAMQYVHGKSLAQVLTALVPARERAAAGALRGRDFLAALQAGQPDVDEAAITAAVRGLDADWNTVTAALLLPVVDALAHAHSRGILHRDVKPSNVMIAETGRALLVDFGLATFDGRSGSITRTGAFLGSLAYMAPEQIDGGAVDARGDVFAVGCLLHEMLALRPAFEAQQAQHTMNRIAFHEPSDLRRANPAVSSDFAAVVAKCLEKRPERRYASPSDVASDLRALLEHRPVSAERLTPLVQVARFARREPLRAWLYAVSAAALLIVAATGGYLWAQRTVLEAGREKLTADRLESNLVAGYHALVQGRNTAAAEHFVRARALAPESFEAQWGLARARHQPAPPTAGAADDAAAPGALFTAGWSHLFPPPGVPVQPDEALALLQRAVLHAPAPRPAYHGYLGIAAALAGDEIWGRRAAEALRRLWPEIALCQHWAGCALIQFDPAAAVAPLERAVELDPELAAAHGVLGGALLALGRDPEALAHAERAVELDDRDCKAWINVGLARQQVGQPERALIALRRATDLPDAVPGAFYALGTLLAATDPEAALRAFEQTVERNPDHAEAWSNIGTLRCAAGAPGAGAVAFGRLTTLRPRWSEAFRNLGYAHAASGNAPGAVAAYQRVVELAPRDAAAHEYLCTLLEHMDDAEALRAETTRFAALQDEEIPP